LLAVQTRSGLVETIHDGAIAVVSRDGDLVAHSGDIDRPFYLRSAAKPFQAAISQEEGAALPPVELALAAASHDGEPVHVAIVESILKSVGLGEADLGCPPALPLAEGARRRHFSRGAFSARPLWNNCSGKHAAWLKTCQVRAWPSGSYLSPSHPLQRRIIDYVSDLGDAPVTPVGIDGCGAPVLRTTTRVMALLYARLATRPELGEVFTAMHRYPALVSGSGGGEAAVARALDAVAKRGAAGCLGVAINGHLGLAVKSWDGNQAAAEVAMIATLADLDALTAHGVDQLGPFARPRVFGGGQVVGALEPAVELDRA
jgi:L-asparaginase II